MRGFFKRNLNIIKITSLVSVLALLVLIGSMQSKNVKVHATTDPLASATISSGSITPGGAYTDLPVTGIQVSGVSDPSTIVPIQLFIPKDSGVIYMNDSTGLTFTGNSKGYSLMFSGTLTDVNNALNTLQLHTKINGNISIKAYILNAGYVYDSETGRMFYVDNSQYVSWNDAVTTAAGLTYQGHTGYLASITSSDQNFLATQMANSLDSNLWIGGSDAADYVNGQSQTAGVWKWTQGPESGTQFYSGIVNNSPQVPHTIAGVYSNFAQGEPNNPGTEPCTELYSGSGEWNNLPCDVTLNPLVEFGSPADPVNPPASSVTTTTITNPDYENITINDCSLFNDIANNPLYYVYTNFTLSHNLNCGGDTYTSLFYNVYDSVLDENIPFKGTFNGANHSIDNLIINQQNGEGNTGLFSYVYHADIHNLTLGSNVSVTGDVWDCVGGFVGYAESSNLNNLHFEGQVIGGYSTIGGIIGCYYSYNDNGTYTINNNVLIGSVTSDTNWTYRVGGIIGQYRNYSPNSHVELSNNSFEGTINVPYSNGSQVGGIIGYLRNSDGAQMIVQENNSAGSISNFSDNVGGIIGYLDNYNQGSRVDVINNSNHTDLISDYATRTGGIIGDLYDEQTIDIKLNVNYATIQVNNSGDEVGGIIGNADIESYDTGIQAHITQNKNVGEINATNDFYDVGGIIGYLYTYDDGGYNQNAYIAAVTKNINFGNIDSYNEVGGIIGYQYSYESSELIDQNISKGNVNDGDGGSNGGIIGYFDGYNNDYPGIHTFSNNYNTGSVSGDTGQIGGLIGYIYSQGYDNTTHGVYQITNNYNAGNINGNNSGYGNVSGLVGGIDSSNTDYNEFQFNNNFQNGTILDNGDNYGQILGSYYMSDTANPIVSENNYFGSNTSGSVTTCIVPASTTDCTNVDTESTPNYFSKDNTVKPMSLWNFDTVWGFSSEINNGMPCLLYESEQCMAPQDADYDGVSNAVENQAPNNGDANNDGIVDGSQTNVTSIQNSTNGKYISVQTNCGTNFNTYSEDPSTKDSGYNYEGGLVGFGSQQCGDPGTSVTVDIYFYGDYDVNKVVLREYNPNTKSYTNVDNAVLTSLVIGGQKVIKAQYTVVDGGKYDLDGTVNGSISDPVGLGTLAVAAPNTGFPNLLSAEKVNPFLNILNTKGLRYNIQ